MHYTKVHQKQAAKKCNFSWQVKKQQPNILNFELF